MSREEGSAVCARCGACLPVCPVYRHTLLERFGPRGKHALLDRGKVDFSLDSVRETVSACLQCGACAAACSAGIAVNSEILCARAKNSEFAPSWPLLWKLLSTDTAWSAVSGFLSSLPAASGILYRLASVAVSYRSSFGTEFLPAPAPVPLLSQRGLKRFSSAVSSRRGLSSTNPLRGKRVGLFAGCVQNFIYPDIPAAMAAWFPDSEFIVPAGQCCCGLPALSAGAVEPAQRLIERNLKIFEELECDVILTGCASCSYMIRKWPEIVESRSRTMAERAAAGIREFTELAQNADCSRPEPSVSGRVAFHAPCHSRFSSQGTVAAETFLRKVLGDNFVEIGQGCCGHGGSFSIKHAEISRSIFRERLDALRESGASTIVTTCSGCLLQWRSLASRQGAEALKVLHASEIGKRSHAV